MKRYLTCGCCGEGFERWPEYIDQDQDQGYGICRSCQGSITDTNRKHVDDCIGLIADALCEDNRTKFLASDRSTQEALVVKAHEDGLIKWVIGGARHE